MRIEGLFIWRWGPQEGEVTRLSIQSLISICSRLRDRWGDHMRDYMDRLVTSCTKRVTSPT